VPSSFVTGLLGRAPSFELVPEALDFATQILLIIVFAANPTSSYSAAVKFVFKEVDFFF
jgi:hypothetical protein